MFRFSRSGTSVYVSMVSDSTNVYTAIQITLRESSGRLTGSGYVVHEADKDAACYSAEMTILEGDPFRDKTLRVFTKAPDKVNSRTQTVLTWGEKTVEWTRLENYKE